MRKVVARAVVALFVASVLGCGEYGGGGRTHGLANREFGGEMFIATADPPNFGSGVVHLSIDGQERTLAQGTSAIAIDIEGRPNSDPEQADFFAVQIFQYLSPTEAEVFELRVRPDLWVDETEVAINTADGDALFGSVSFDRNGAQLGGELLLTAVRGTLTLEAAGQFPGEDVRGFFSDLELISP